MSVMDETWYVDVFLSCIAASTHYEFIQVDHTDEDRASVDSFSHVSDSKLEPCPRELVSLLLEIINCSTKRIPKRRQTSAQV